MNEKISLQDLINLFSEKQGINKRDAELFVRSMFDLIEEALAAEKYVKVKGLGTFKLTEVDSRESVNVNTGERIDIQGHTKVSFTPDSMMKDLINKPFAHFETVVLNDGVELEDTPIENTVDDVTIVEETRMELIVEASASVEESVKEPIVEKTIVEPITDEPKEESVVDEVVEKVVTVEETIVEEFVEEIVEKPAEVISMVEPQPEITEPKEEVLENHESTEEKAFEERVVEEKIVEDVREKSINRILWGVIMVLVLIILFGAYWMFFRSEENTPELIPVTPIQEEQVLTPVPIAEEKSQEETLKTVQFIELSAEELRKERVPSLADTLDYQIVGTQEEYVLQNGETIIRVSVRFFGTKKYWPYLVKYNMDVLKDPDNIPVGIRIKIPKLVEKH